MANKDLYSVLGLQHGASIDEVKKAFKKLAVQYHPDKQQGKSDAEKKAAEEKFKEINEAYTILSDPQKKQEYDNFGSVGGGMNMGGGFSDLGDIIRHMHSTGGFDFDGFNPFGGGARQRAEVPGENVRIRLNCSIEDIYNGTTKTIKYDRKVKCHSCNGTGSKDGKSGKCSYCNGTGQIRKTSGNAFMTQTFITDCPHCHGTGQMITNPCHTCGGTGLETQKETLTVTIPQEVRDGNIIEMPGMGHMAPNGGSMPGNLHIMFSVAPHPVFTISPDGCNLECKIDVNVMDCITGCKKEITGINGKKLNVNIPMGTKDKQTITINGNGMPLGNGRYGNLIVTVNQIMPKTLSKDNIKVINELKNNLKF